MFRAGIFYFNHSIIHLKWQPPFSPNTHPHLAMTADQSVKTRAISLHRSAAAHVVDVPKNVGGWTPFLLTAIDHCVVTSGSNLRCCVEVSSGIIKPPCSIQLTTCKEVSEVFLYLINISEKIGPFNFHPQRGKTGKVLQRKAWCPLIRCERTNGGCLATTLKCSNKI